MRKSIILVIVLLVAVLVLTGCIDIKGILGGLLPGGDPGEGSDSSEPGESSIESSTEPAVEAVWTKDVVLGDPWTPSKKLSDVPLITPSISSEEALPIRIELWEEDEKSQKYDTRDGGVETDTSYAKISEKSLEELEGADLMGFKRQVEQWNAWARMRAGSEMEEGEVRFKAYKASPDSQDYIYLTSWISVRVARADTQMLSYISEIYRYNRDYEPNYYEYHGVTVDSATGELYTLKDIFTDIDGLVERIGQITGPQNVAKDGSPEQAKLLELIREAIEGCRDDGSFAWSVYPDGIQFYLVQEKTDSDGLVYHTQSQLFLPFVLCEGILREGVTEVDYDYLFYMDHRWFEPMLGFEAPRHDDGSVYTTFYLGQKDGQRYLYGCDNGYTVTFDLYENGEAFRTDAPGEIEAPFNERYSTMPDMDDLKLTCMVQLFQELFLEGRGRIGDDGAFENVGLFNVTNYGMPFSFDEDLEAEILLDEEGEETEWGIVPAYEFLTIFRTDGETFIDCQFEGGACRLYIEGDPDNGWLINGIPKNEIIAHEGYFEE